MTVWRALWIAWAVCTIVSFLIIETAGYAHHGTLSETIWSWLGIGRDLTWGYLTRRLVLAFFLIWMFLHFFFQVE